MSGTPMMLAFWVMSLASAKPKDIASIAITPPAKGGLCVGEVHDLEVVATDASGKTRKLKFGRKPEVAVSWEIGAVSNGGKLEMPSDPRVAWGKVGKLAAASMLDPSKTAEIAVPLRFDCSTVVDLTGREGDTGTQGEDGGSSQAKGTDARPGQMGSTGGAGPEVHVRLTAVEEPLSHAQVVQAEIRELGHDEVRYVAFTPGSGELVVKANGGRGGKGGDGGTGGDGDLAGAGGDGGNGGNGGTGGTVTVFVDESARACAKSVVVENAGGEGGMAGAGGGPGAGGLNSKAGTGRTGLPGNQGPDGPMPEVQPAVVAPLW